MLKPFFVDVRQGAAFLNVSRSTVYELVAAGELHLCKFGRSSKLAIAELERLAQERYDQAVRSDRSPGNSNCGRGEM